MIDFCQRLGIATNAGIPLLDVLRREAGRGRYAPIIAEIVSSLESGSTFAEALSRHPRHFDEMFVTLVEVGEQSGMLGETLNELADYYEQRKKIKRNFLKALILPAIELFLVFAICGGLIFFGGIIGSMTGTTFDPLGWGLTGLAGLVKYLMTIGFIVCAGIGFYVFVTKSAARSRYVHYMLSYIPQVGTLFKKMALARLTWALGITMRTGMDVPRALSLSFRTATYAPISDQLKPILETLRNGGSLADAFGSAVGFDSEFLASVDIGEQSGNFPETMLRLAKMYNAQAMLQLKVVSHVASWLVYGLVGLIIIVLIFQMAFFYFGAIQDALNQMP